MLLLPLFLLAQPEPAPTDAPEVLESREVTQVTATSGQLFALADAALARNDERLATQVLIALLADPDVKLRNEARFRLAMLSIRREDWTDAGTYLRAIIDEEPEAHRARLELARVQAEMGQIDASRRTLREAQAGGLPPDVARLVERFSAALREHKPFGASLQIAIAPDSNVNRATRSETLGTVIGDFELDEEARQSSGIGLSFDSQGYFRKRLTKSTSLLARAGLSGDFYDDSRFNNLLAIASVGPEFSLYGGRATLLVGGQRRWFGGDRYYDALSANLQWQRGVGPRSQVRAGFGFTNFDYRINKLQNSDTFNGFATFETAFGARTGISITLAASRQLAGDPAYSTASGQISATGWRDLGRTTVFVSATYQRLENDKRLAIYPSRRKDDFLQASLGATFRSLSWRGWAPQAKLVRERNWSPIEIYDYQKWRAELGFVRAF